MVSREITNLEQINVLRIAPLCGLANIAAAGHCWIKHKVSHVSPCGYVAAVGTMACYTLFMKVIGIQLNLVDTWPMIVM
jgi:hypothetical protein